jgi:HlyD family secretion protein
VTVDAYPGRTFRGVVEKVEPRATVQQSVTFFPVLIRIDNRDGALMPGMNSDVSVLVDERRDVLAVPIDAVRPLREAATAATALGVDPEVVRQAVQAARGGGRARQGDTGAGATAVPATGAAAPAGRGDSAARGGGRAGRGGRGGGAGRSGGGGATTRAVVFVRAGTGFQPRVVTLGLSNYDFAEVRDGLRPGEQVALVSAAVLQQSRTERQQQLRSRSGLPGMGGGGAGGGGGRGGSGGGGGGGGGGGRGGS